MNKIITLSICGLTLSASAYAQNTLKDSLKAKIEYLASPALEGRGFEGNGNKKAAEYLNKFFEEIKLKKFNNSYYQDFSAPVALELGKANSLEFTTGNNKISFKPDEEYLPLKFSGNKEAKGDLVFVGYGVSSEKIHFDEYANLDVKNKIVLILRGSPDKYNDTSKFGEFTSMRYKLNTAKEKGAAGVILVSFEYDLMENLPSLELERYSAQFDIPLICMKLSALKKLGNIFDKIDLANNKIKEFLKPNSFAISDLSVNMQTELKQIDKKMPNIVGYLEGNEKKEEYIVIGGHFDHLGFGGSSSLSNEKKAHIGADDNASGTAAMMQLAYRLKDKKLKRSVIFVGFNGEEIGLLGSSHFVKNPPVPIDNIAAMLNFDMVGRMNEDKLSILGAGTSSIWKKIIEKANSNNIKITETDDGMGPSDNASFLPKNIPVLFFFTGVHTDYHKPSDSPDKINYDGEGRIIDLAEKIIIETANNEKRPDYVKIESKESKREMKGAKVQFGAIPDFGDNSKGFKVSGASPGTPADKAGVKANDIILKFGEKPIKDIYDFMDALQSFNPGDEVKVEILRGTETIVLKAILSAKKGSK